MRTEKELWELVLSRQDLFLTGLCRWVYCLNYDSLITCDEFIFLKSILHISLPEIKPNTAYCWECGELQPRIDWINKRIKQIENETR